MGKKYDKSPSKRKFLKKGAGKKLALKVSKKNNQIRFNYSDEEVLIIDKIENKKQSPN